MLGASSVGSTNDEVHLCQRASGEHECNVILEELRDDRLIGRCTTLHTWTTIASLAGDLGVPPARVALLGHLGNQPHGALRDGDVIHYPVVSGAKHTFAPRLIGCVVGVSGRRQGVRGCSLLPFYPSSSLRSVPALPLFQLMELPPAPLFSTGFWSPYKGSVSAGAPEIHTLMGQLLRDEPWWSPDLVQVLPRLGDNDRHWVPRSPSAAFVVALLSGPPAPAAVLLPQELPKQALLSIIRRHYPNAICIKGRIPSLAQHVPGTTSVRLRDGDILTVHVEGWQPSLHQPSPSSFPSHAAARTQGLWSHALEFHSDCWVLLWPAPGQPPVALFASGNQRWDPVARTLRPALDQFLEAWWPSILGLASTDEPLHLVAEAGDLADQVNVLTPQPWRCFQVPRDRGCCRTGDVVSVGSHDHASLPALSPGVAPGSPTSTCRHMSPRPSALFLLALVLSRLPANWRSHSAWGLLLLSCYLAAYGAPLLARPPGSSAGWTLCMADVAALTAKLHEYWWTTALCPHLPASFAWPLQHAWTSFPLWTGGVPSSLFLATDGSGRNGGSWAFAVWAYASPRWYRIGWASASLADTPWLPAQPRDDAGLLASYTGELTALQSAGLWVAAQLDLWQLHMGCRPGLVTVAVDNAAALMTAAGQGKATTLPALLARRPGNLSSPVSAPPSTTCIVTLGT